MTTHKRLTSGLVLALLIACTACRGTADTGDWTIEEQVLELHVTRVDGGYGYYITHGGDTTIWQPFIPALPGSRPFATEDEAACVGQLVIDKLLRGDDPGLTPSEVKPIINQP